MRSLDSLLFRGLLLESSSVEEHWAGLHFGVAFFTRDSWSRSSVLCALNGKIVIAATQHVCGGILLVTAAAHMCDSRSEDVQPEV